MKQKTIKTMMSSATDQWNTPQWLIDQLAIDFDWDLDVCASSSNVCDNYISANSLLEIYPWRGLCWMNPPYGREIGEWMTKAKESSHHLYTTVVCLVPARTDTKWWQNNTKSASMIVFIKGRLKFNDQKNSAPFPSAIVVFGELTSQQSMTLFTLGQVVYNQEHI